MTCSSFRFLVSLVCLIAFWEGVVLLFALPNYILPSPKAVLTTLWTFFPELFLQTRTTFYETILGLCLGCITSIFFVISLITIRPLRLLLLPLLLISQALPIFAIAPLLVLWFGFGMISKVCVVMLMTFFPITSSLFDGFHRIPREYIEMAQHMRAKTWPMLRYIYIPYTLPYLASGLRISAVFAPMGAIISEWVGSSYGLGYVMINANARLDTSLVFAAILVLIIMALSLYFAIDLFFKWWITWA